ncbi:DNA-directed RNA polymerase subunit alpha [Candidatus Margulisiibacteriota bacterium]
MSKPNPWVKYEEIEKNAGKFIIEPLTRGMGTTLGNALRRVLLSSLEGLAVTSVQIEGVEHEFGTVKNVKEDVLDIICNLKGLIFSSSPSEQAEINIEIKDKGNFKGKDIKSGSDLEIINKTHHILEITDKTKLSLKLGVKKGVGYQSAEKNKEEGMPINTIFIDSSFSPIIRVNHVVDHIRVGEELDYESLKLEVWTNGSIKPNDAMREASELMGAHLALFGDMNKKPKVEEEDKSEDLDQQKRESALVLSIDDLELSARSSNCLKRAGIETVKQLVEKDLSELIKIKNFGKKSADEINEKLQAYNLCLKGTTEDFEE